MKKICTTITTRRVKFYSCMRTFVQRLIHHQTPFLPSSIKLEFHVSSFLLASSWHLHRHARYARHPREDATRMARVSGLSNNFLFSLRLAYLIGRPAVCCGVESCPLVRVLCRSPNSTSPTRTTCSGYPREDPCSILVRHVRRARMLRDATMNLLPWNLSFTECSHKLTPR